jgi:putative oxidoreductase
MIKLYRQFERLCQQIPESAILLLGRIMLAHSFWASGRTKVEGFALNPITIDLFRDEYHMPWPELLAPSTAIAEHILPILLILGLGTRFAAAGITIMALVIQIFIYPEAFWTVHGYWLAVALMLLARGGGKLSFDSALKISPSLNTPTA